MVLFFLWKNRNCSLRRKIKGVAWNKYNGLLRASLFSSATSLLAFFLLCSSRTEIIQFVSLFGLHFGSQNNTNVSQIFDHHPKKKLGKIESISIFFSCFSVVLHYILKALSTATIPLVFECISNRVNYKNNLLEHLLTTSFKEFALVKKFKY